MNDEEKNKIAHQIHDELEMSVILENEKEKLWREKLNAIKKLEELDND